MQIETFCELKLKRPTRISIGKVASQSFRKSFLTIHLEYLCNRMSSLQVDGDEDGGQWPFIFMCAVRLFCFRFRNGPHSLIVLCAGDQRTEADRQVAKLDNVKITEQ